MLVGDSKLEIVAINVLDQISFIDALKIDVVCSVDEVGHLAQKALLEACLIGVEQNSECEILNFSSVQFISRL